MAIILVMPHDSTYPKPGKDAGNNQGAGNTGNRLEIPKVREIPKALAT